MDIPQLQNLWLSTEYNKEDRNKIRGIRILRKAFFPKFNLLCLCTFMIRKVGIRLQITSKWQSSAQIK